MFVVGEHAMKVTLQKYYEMTFLIRFFDGFMTVIFLLVNILSEAAILKNRI